METLSSNQISAEEHMENLLSVADPARLEKFLNKLFVSFIESEVDNGFEITFRSEVSDFRALLHFLGELSSTSLPVPS